MLLIIFRLGISITLIAAVVGLFIMVITEEDFDLIKPSANTKLAREYALKAFVAAGMTMMGLFLLVILALIWGF